MDKPVIKIEKGLAEILNFPEEPCIKFLKDYNINCCSIESIKTDGNFDIDLTKYIYSVTKNKVYLEDIYINICKLFILNEVFKTNDYTLSKDESKIDFRFNPYKVKCKIATKYIFEEHVTNYTVKLHYKYTDYKVYSESYRIMNSPDSKDFKPIIIEKIKEKIYYCLNELNTIFKNQRKVVWNNLIELCKFDISKLDINIKDFIVDKKPMMKTFLKYKSLDKLEDAIYDKPYIEDTYQETNNCNYFYIINYYIKLLDNIYGIDKIVCFLQLINEINLDTFGQKTVNLLIETGLPF